MKLYYSTGACSLAPHIVLAELGMAYETQKVDLKTHKLENGDDYYAVNVKGSVPALRMDNGEILTEGAVISQYIADQKPEGNLIPRPGTVERYRCMEWLNFIGSEVHKTMGAIFGTDRMMKTDAGKEEFRAAYRGVMQGKLKFISERLGSNDYLMGKQFTVADAYLFTVLGWSDIVGVDLTPWKNIQDYKARVAARPAVQKAMKAEGLIK